MRLPRHLQNDATYHVCAQINRQEMIFQTGDFMPEMGSLHLRPDAIKELFMKVMKEAREKYEFSIKNFCIMGNHIHLLIKPHKDESLSSIMQWILSVFARRFNIIFNLKGHVWYDRFKSRVIESIEQLINTFLYISNNPIRAGLVNTPLEYLYNGFYHIATNNYMLVDPPDQILESIIQNYLQNINFMSAITIDRSIGFYPNKPGRKKQTHNDAKSN